MGFFCKNIVFFGKRKRRAVPDLVTGQSTLEVLIALGIIVISISAGIMTFFGGQSLLVDTQLSNEASYRARELLENARSGARQNFSSVVTASSTEGRFLKEVIVDDVDAATKKVTARVTWDATSSRPENVEVVTYLTDWRNVTPPPDPGDTGGGGTSGDWKNPRTLGSVDLGPGNSATDLDVVNKMVYLTSEASAASKPDFYVVNATDGQNPFIVSELNVGVAGLIALDASGSYAYTVEKNNHQIKIIDVSNPSAPEVVSTLHLEGAGEERKGLSIFYTAGKVYVGTTAGAGPEFHVIDVSSPASPATVGYKEIGADVNKIYVAGAVAYLATGADASEIVLFDVTSPSNVVQLGTFNAAGTADAKSDYLAGKKLYLGRLSSGNPEFHVLGVTDPAAPSGLGATDLGGDVNDITLRDQLAFLANSDSNSEFQVWNVTTSSEPTFWSSFNFPQVASGIDYEDNIVYVSVRSNDALRIITSGP